MEKQPDDRKFYILEIERDRNQDDKIIDYHFIEVEGELVDLGFGVQGFVTNGSAPGGEALFWRAENWRVVHLETGARIAGVCRNKARAIGLAKDRMVANQNRYEERREMFIREFGKSPAVEVENENDAT